MTRREVLALGLVVLALGTAALVIGGLGGGRTIEVIERSFLIQPGQEIFVQSRNGAVTYEYWEGDRVFIRASKESAFSLFPGLSRWINDWVKVEFTETANGVRAVHSSLLGWFLFGNVEVEFHVLAPESWHGSISLQTSNGRITAKDLHGEARQDVQRRDLRRETVGRLEVKTSNGRIELSQVNGVVQAETSNGPVRIDGGTLAQNGRIRTSNGPIDSRAKLDADATYELRTSNGRVNLVLHDPDVRIDLRTSNGDIDLDTEVSVSEFGRSRLVGRIGEGRSQLNVRTSNGDITLAAARQSQ